MPKQFRILSLGASYGSLLAVKLLAAGHSVRLVCLPAEADVINAEGCRVRLPIKGRDGVFEIDTRNLTGDLSAGGANDVDPANFDLVVLAMQEPQYRSPDVRKLVDRIANTRIPCMSIMNMPPLPYLARVPGVSVEGCRPCYTDPAVWDAFDPALMTLCSPDPQAFRPPDEKVNVLQVRLATNFKAARFESDAHTAMLRELEWQIDAARFDSDAGPIDAPVKLRVHDSVFVPLAKWSMLVAGNYRCVQEDSVRSIRDAVHSDLEASRAIYGWVFDLCRSLGADERDLVPFDKYANAAASLVTPSSAARALANGATHIERVDRLVQTIAAQQRKRSIAVDEIVATVDAWLEANRRKAGGK